MNVQSLDRGGKYMRIRGKQMTEHPNKFLFHHQLVLQKCDWDHLTRNNAYVLNMNFKKVKSTYGDPAPALIFQKGNTSF